MADRIHRTRFELTAQDGASRVFQSVGKGLEGLQAQYIALGTAAAAALGAGAFVADAIKYRSALDDLADTTGDNVRTLDGLARQARVSGVEFDQLSGSLAKFARNLNSADDEGKAAAQAIEAIGLSVDELRARKPAEAMIEVARALGGFEDGASKVAVATALMGREGAKMLPYLKDIAEAGELNGKITAEQAAEAEKLEKEWRKLKIAFEDGKQGIATALIPALSSLIEQMREGIRLAGGFGNALLLFGSINPFRSVQGNINTLKADIEGLRTSQVEARSTADQLRAQGEPESMLAGYQAAIAQAEQEIQRKQKQLEFLRFQQRQDALRLTGPEYLDARDLMANAKPTLNFSAKPPAAAPAAKPEKDNTAAEYARSLQMQNAILDEANVLGAKYLEQQQKKRDALEAEAEALRDLLDPQRKLFREEERLIELRAEAVITEEEYIRLQLKRAEDARAEIIRLGGSVEVSKNAFADMGFTATSALEDIIVRGGKAGDVIRALGMDLARILFRQSIGNPLAAGASDFISGLFRRPASLPDAQQAGSGVFGGFDSGAIANMDFVGAFASGSKYVPRTGMALVHQGETITPAGQSGGGGVNVVMNNTFEGGTVSPAQLAAVQRAAVAGVLEAKRRGGAFAEAFA